MVVRGLDAQKMLRGNLLGFLERVGFGRLFCVKGGNLCVRNVIVLIYKGVTRASGGF